MATETPEDPVKVPKIGMTARFMDVEPRMKRGGGYLGAVVVFEDDTHWKLSRMLSETRYQLSIPPYEAAQVFACKCLEDPHGKWQGVDEMVMKVKYQLQGTHANKRHHQLLVLDCEDDLRNPDGYSDNEGNLKQAKRWLYAATNPVLESNEATDSEIAALSAFHELKCANAPTLHGAIQDINLPGVDDWIMPEGYVMFILMDKLPGKPLDHCGYWKLDSTVRDKIRQAFKEALKEVWSCRIGPLDCGLRNIMWDEVQEKCYIVDFEEYVVIDRSDHPAAQWSDTKQFKRWGLAEECKPEMPTVSSVRGSSCECILNGGFG